MTKVKDKVSALTSGNWKKLMLELVVVFLGVSAGFLLNSWRTQNQEKHLERQYIERFLQDVNDDIIELEEAVSYDSLWLDRAKPLLISIRDQAIELDSAKAVIKQITQLSRLETHKGTYADITNSGNLSIIRDFELKRALVDYHIEIEGVEFLNDYFYNYFNDFVMPFIISEYSIVKEEFNDPQVIKTTQFSNVVAGYYSMVQQRKDANKQLLERSYELQGSLQSKDTE
jgi:hypothetical protein